MVEFITGDSREALRGLPDQSVNCVITSPPYFGLRDYGTGTWEGGSSECDHVETVQNLNSGFNERWGNSPGDRKQENCRVSQYRGSCAKCGATRRDRQIGLEPTLEAYINELMAVFAEVKRVLRDDGTFWLNLGDSYNSNSSRRDAGFNARYHGCSDAGKQADTDLQKPERPRVGAISSKSLIGMPWRVAFALQADGWILRSDIIWNKPNCMPESVTDRPTRAHEYLFMFAKSERYWYDADAVREPHKPQSLERDKSGWNAAFKGRHTMPGEKRPHSTDHDGFCHPLGRNRRTVWSITTKSFKGAHFATFPPALVEPALLAGCPVGGTVLDPFAGAGTVGLVAQQHGRNAILVELNPSYVTLAKERLCATT